MMNKVWDVLLVEDNSGDVILFEEAFKEDKSRERMEVNLHVVEDGERALEYLRQNGAYTHVAKPDLIILDLNLPKVNGYDVLKDIRRREETKKIPIVVLTTSHASEDVQKSYDLGATCFITKPFGFYQFMEAVEQIKKFWLNLVTLPQPAK